MPFGVLMLEMWDYNFRALQQNFQILPIFAKYIFTLIWFGQLEMSNVSPYINSVSWNVQLFVILNWNVIKIVPGFSGIVCLWPRG